MRTLSTALNNALGAVVTRPAYLVYIGLTSPLRYSTHSSPTFMGKTWTAYDVAVNGLRVGALAISGSLIFGNADSGFSAIALGSEGLTDKQVKIWGYDAAATASDNDIVLLCDGVGGACDIALDRVKLTVRDPSEYKVGPRRLVSPMYGYTTNIPAGRSITINNITFQVMRGR
jgi:hypothetical protein